MFLVNILKIYYILYFLRDYYNLLENCCNHSIEMKG